MTFSRTLSSEWSFRMYFVKACISLKSAFRKNTAQTDDTSLTQVECVCGPYSVSTLCVKIKLWLIMKIGSSVYWLVYAISHGYLHPVLFGCYSYYSFE